MFCSKCGKQISDNALFCEFCGAPTSKNIAANSEDLTKSEVEIVPVQNVQPVSEQQTVSQQAEQPKKTINILGIIGFVLSMASLGLSAYMIYRSIDLTVFEGAFDDYYFNYESASAFYTFFAYPLTTTLISSLLAIVALIISGIAAMNSKKYKYCNGLGVAGLIISIFTSLYWVLAFIINIISGYFLYIFNS